MRKSHLESGISFQSVFAPSVSRQCPVHVPSTYLTIPVHAIREPFLNFFSPYKTASSSNQRKTIRRPCTIYEPHYHKPKRSQIISLRFPCSKPYAYISENGKQRGTPIICRFRILSQSPPSKRTAHSRIVSRFFCISADYTHNFDNGTLQDPLAMVALPDK